MQITTVTRRLLQGSMVIQAAGAALAVGGAAYYFSHPQRFVTELPDNLRSSAQSVMITAVDGAKLHATWIPGSGADGKPFDRTLVHHHGYNSCGGVLLSRKTMFQGSAVPLPWVEQREPLCAWPLVNEALRRGYNLLLVDARAHGRSSGSWDTTGAAAVSDAALWARWLRDEQTQLWAALWGNSYGGAVGLALALRPSGGGFDAMVLDSPVVTPEGVYSGVVRGPLYRLLHPVFERIGNKNLYPSLRDLRPWMPILFIHGLEDGHVPAWQSERVYELIRDERRPERTQLWLVPGAAHLQSLEVAPEEYVRRTLDWFDKWL